MKTWKFANRRSIRVFQIEHSYVAIATGTKPKACTGPQITVLRSGRLILHCDCAVECADAKAPEDDYFVVQVLSGLNKTRGLEVVHSAGRQLVQIEQLCPGNVTASAEPFALGVSQDFSLEAAFKDALAGLDPKTKRSPGLVEVVSMGALYGGFSGFSRLFVRIEKRETDRMKAEKGTLGLQK